MGSKSRVDSSKRFLERLKGVEDRKISEAIGGEFIAVFDERARQMASGPDRPAFLVQGTLYPDVIESVAVRVPRKPSRRTIMWEDFQKICHLP